MLRGCEGNVKEMLRTPRPAGLPNPQKSWFFWRFALHAAVRRVSRGSGGVSGERCATPVSQRCLNAFLRTGTCPNGPKQLKILQKAGFARLRQAPPRRRAARALAPRQLHWSEGGAQPPSERTVRFLERACARVRALLRGCGAGSGVCLCP